MSTRASGYAKSLQVCPNGERITRGEKSVLMILADSHQDRAHRPTFPSVEGMAEDGIISERQFLRILASLEGKGVIRREYPDGRGRGKTTFYFFPELDSSESRAASNAGSKKGCQNVTLFETGSKSVSSEKGDRRVTNRAPLILSNKYNKSKNKSTPVIPASGDAERVTPIAALHAAPAPGPGTGPGTDPVERGVERVMRDCDFVGRRLRRMLGEVMVAAIGKGVSAETAAAAMTQAWRDQAAASHLLRYVHAPRAFYTQGLWANSGAWAWDSAAVEQQRRSLAGVFR